MFMPRGKSQGAFRRRDGKSETAGQEGSLGTQWASATAWVAGTQPRGSDLLVHDGALTTGLFQELPSQFKLQPGLTTCSGHCHYADSTADNSMSMADITLITSRRQLLLAALVGSVGVSVSEPPTSENTTNG